MAKVSANYEVLYIISPDLGEEDTAALVEKFKALIEANGTLNELEQWGKRKLAYPINKTNEGYYVFVDFTYKPEEVAVLKRALGYNEQVLRHIVVRKA